MDKKIDIVTHFLKNCPFCGGEPRLVINDLQCLTPIIECQKCSIEVAYGDCISSAIELWNNRINLPEAPKGEE